EDSLGIVHTDHFVKLQQVDMISLKPAKRFVDLICGGLGIAAVDLRHQESLLPIAIAESLAHADLAFSAVVIPAIIEEVDAFVESRSDNADALVLIALIPNVVTAESDRGDLLAGVTERPAWNRTGRGVENRIKGRGDSGNSDCLEELATFHDAP